MTRKRSKRPHSRTKSRAAVSPDQRGKDHQPASSEPAGESAQQPFLSAAGLREVVESVVIAFVLAFLFRTFEAEAFVIPTGSMAPTLMGRHKDLVCSQCGHRFQVSASKEIHNITGRPTGERVVGGTCPMCRHTMDLGPHNSEHKTYRSYKGDRILVAKFAYRFGGPQRWDVAVFKYPGGAKTNFIKRIVGLPNETIGISRGDLYVKPVEEIDFDRFATPSSQSANAFVDLDEFTIARKSPAKVRAMLQPVYDNDRVLPEIIEAGWPPRWSPVARTLPSDGHAPHAPPNGQAAGWQTSEDYRSFHTDGSAEGEVWIAYRHFVPSYQDWQDLKNGSLPAGRNPEPELITDFSAYNTEVISYGSSQYGADNQWYGGYGYDPYGGSFNEQIGREPTANMSGLHWVGDLAVECTMEVESGSGEAVFELVEGGEVFRCRIDVASGQATLSIDGEPEFHPSAKTRVRGPGTYRIMFSNVDDQLLLWVNGRVVRFDQETTYRPLGNSRPRSEDRQRPVRIGSRGAGLRISHLKIHRDIYYIAQRLARGDPGGKLTDLDRSAYQKRTREEVAQVLADPHEWAFFRSARQIVFPLGEDQFLVLTRNYAQRRNSGLWMGQDVAHHVSRELLSGAATDLLDSGRLRTREEVARLLYLPHEWAFYKAMRRVAFPLADDQFLVLGDNSAESKDSRLWESEYLDHYVSRDLLMGKALFVYWPHSLDQIPYTNIPIRFLPNFSRMHFVR